MRAPEPSEANLSSSGRFRSCCFFSRHYPGRERENSLQLLLLMLPLPSKSWLHHPPSNSSFLQVGRKKRRLRRRQPSRKSASWDSARAQSQQQVYAALRRPSPHLANGGGQSRLSQPRAEWSVPAISTLATPSSPPAASTWSRPANQRSAPPSRLKLMSRFGRNQLESSSTSQSSSAQSLPAPAPLSAYFSLSLSLSLSRHPIHPLAPRVRNSVSQPTQQHSTAQVRRTGTGQSTTTREQQRQRRVALRL